MKVLRPRWRNEFQIWSDTNQHQYKHGDKRTETRTTWDRVGYQYT